MFVNTILITGACCMKECSVITDDMTQFKTIPDACIARATVVLNLLISHLNAMHIYLWGRWCSKYAMILRLESDIMDGLSFVASKYGEAQLSCVLSLQLLEMVYPLLNFKLLLAFHTMLRHFNTNYWCWYQFQTCKQSIVIEKGLAERHRYVDIKFAKYNCLFEVWKSLWLCNDSYENCQEYDLLNYIRAPAHIEEGQKIWMDDPIPLKVHANQTICGYMPY